MRYTIYSDLAMTNVHREIDTHDPAIIAAMRNLLQSANIIDPDKLPLPFRFDPVGVVIHEI